MARPLWTYIASTVASAGRTDRVADVLVQMLARRLKAVLFGAATARKATAADVLVQTTIELQAPAVFTIFGGAWMGVGQYLLYCRLFEAMVPGTTAIASVQKRSALPRAAVVLSNFLLRGRVPPGRLGGRSWRRARADKAEDRALALA